MSIPEEPSLLQNEVQIPNAKPRKYLIRSGTDNVLSTLDHISFPFSMHAPCPCRGRQWYSAPSQSTLPSQMIAAARSQIMEVPVSPAARIISNPMPVRPNALLVII